MSPSSEAASAISTAEPKTAAAITAAPTSLVGGPPWMPVLWTAVWPLPRASSQRFTGTVRTNATASAKARLPQKSSVSRPASIAPGMTTRMIALSTTSIVAIESVSEARAIGTTAERARPARSSGRLVSA